MPRCYRCGTDFISEYFEDGLFNHTGYTSDWNLTVEYNYGNLPKYMATIEASHHPGKNDMLRCINLWLKETKRDLANAAQDTTYISLKELNKPVGSCMGVKQVSITKEELARSIANWLVQQYQNTTYYDAAWVNDQYLDQCNVDGHVDLLQLSEYILGLMKENLS